MKKTLIIVLASLLILMPTIIALVLNILPNELGRSPINISGTLLDSNGTTYSFDKDNNLVLTSFFSELESNSAKTDVSVDDIEFDEKLRASVTNKKETKSISLYFSLERPSYFSYDDGVLWQISDEYADTFLNSQFAVNIYEMLHSPKLITYSNYEVNPSASKLKYTTENGSFISGNPKNTAGDPKIYFASNTAKISFSIEPYICEIKAFVNDVLVFEGSLNELQNAKIDKKDTVHYVISAVWEQSETPDCFGAAQYDFYVEYAQVPTFTLDRTSLEAGEFVLVRAENIVDPSKIECSFEGGFKTDPQFFQNGSYYYALIPIDMDLKTGDYKLTLSCAERTKVATLHVTERNRSASATKYELEAPHNQQMLDDMMGLISSVGLNSSDKFYADKAFINYETDYSDSFTLKLGFGRVRSFESGPDFDMIGIEFSAPVDIDIPAINDGIVCASGEDDILGKYIVVDHGYGLKSWYCNISEALFSVGDSVKKGDVIAKTGNSAFYEYTGFYFITTVLDVPVSPYAIYEENFILPD